jgi:hypothetical protein
MCVREIWNDLPVFELTLSDVQTTHLRAEDPSCSSHPTNITPQSDERSASFAPDTVTPSPSLFP